MIVHVYDLTGSATCSVFETSAENGKPQETASHSINRVLIIPETHTNRAPYLQHNEQPILQDLVNEKGEFSYRNAWHWQEYFHDLEEGGNAGVISHFFEALSQESYFGQADRNIILIPDNFSPNTQEYILRNCRLSREKTYLLWRSVATAIGYRKRLQDAKVKNGEEIAIIDIQACETQVSILTMLEHEGKLIPQRRAYKSKSDAYPYHQGEESSITYTNASGKRSDFYNSTFYGKEGDCVVWNDMHRRFEVQSFKPDDGPTLIIPYYCIRSVQEKTCCIQIGGSSSAPPYHQKLLLDRDNKHMLYGAAKFGVLAHTNKILYFDHCEGLYLVVLKRKKQLLEAMELIKENLRSPGGKEIIGTINKETGIAENQKETEFYLLTGSCDDKSNIPLREYIHTFPVGEKHPYARLELHPTFNPGQGIAQVRVKSPILDNEVWLDLLKMTQTAKTIATLQDDVKLQWPIASPGVIAQSRLWENVKPDVERYIKTGPWPKIGELFARSYYPFIQESGLKRLERWNVFGSCENRKLPTDRYFDFPAFFQKLADDYQRNHTYKNNILGLISWTYHTDSNVFQQVKLDCLDYISNPDSNISGLDKKRVFTACANLFATESELHSFFYAFEKQLYSNTTTIYDWLRAMYQLLINHPEMLEHISDEHCKKCMNGLGRILDSRPNNRNIISATLKCMIYLLTRRAYSDTFLQNIRETSLIKFKLERLRITWDVPLLSKASGILNLIDALTSFIDGQGSILGIPVSNSNNG